MKEDILITRRRTVELDGDEFEALILPWLVRFYAFGDTATLDLDISQDVLRSVVITEITND